MNSSSASINPEDNILKRGKTYTNVQLNIKDGGTNRI